MRIKGLRTTKRIQDDGSVQFDFAPRTGRFLSDKIRLTINPDGGALVAFFDGSGLKPDTENGEIISIHIYDEKVAKRIVSAFAFLHLRLEEVETNYTAPDAEMIKNRFVVGVYDEAYPAWVKKTGDVYIVVLNAEASGLPASKRDPVQARMIWPKGRMIVYDANNLDDGLRFISNSSMWLLFNPHESVHLVAGPPPGTLMN